MPNETSDTVDKEKIFMDTALANEMWPEVQQRVGEQKRAAIVYSLIAYMYCATGGIYFAFDEPRSGLICFILGMGASHLGDDYLHRAKATLTWYANEIGSKLKGIN